MKRLFARSDEMRAAAKTAMAEFKALPIEELIARASKHADSDTSAFLAECALDNDDWEALDTPTDHEAAVWQSARSWVLSERIQLGANYFSVNLDRSLTIEHVIPSHYEPLELELDWADAGIVSHEYIENGSASLKLTNWEFSCIRPPIVDKLAA